MAELKSHQHQGCEGERRDPPGMSWVLVSEKTVGARILPSA